MNEHQHIEWKESWRDEYLRWVCGFANAEGGILVIGRNDKGVAVGVPNAKKLVIWNSGILPEDWTIKNLLGKHPSCPFNPLVANAFFRSGYIESWGRGIEKIRQECVAHGIEPPDYDSGMAGLMLTFHANPEHLANAGEAGDTTQKTSVKISVETLGKTLVKTPVKTPEEILAVLRKHPAIPLGEVAESLGKSASAIERAVAKLKAQGRLRRIGPKKGGHWEVIDHE